MFNLVFVIMSGKQSHGSKATSTSVHIKCSTQMNLHFLQGNSFPFVFYHAKVETNVCGQKYWKVNSSLYIYQQVPSHMISHNLNIFQDMLFST